MANFETTNAAFAECFGTLEAMVTAIEDGEGAKPLSDKELDQAMLLAKQCRDFINLIEDCGSVMEADFDDDHAILKSLNRMAKEQSNG